MDPDTVEDWSRDAADTLIPAFEDIYDIELERPLFIARPDESPAAWFRWVPFLSGAHMTCRPMGHAGLEYSLEEERGGSVDIRWDGDPSRELVYTLTAHELGHAAIYQNAPPPLLEYDPDIDNDYVGILHEGVAERFGDRGLDILRREARENGDDAASQAYRAFRRQRDYLTPLVDATWRRVRPTDYSRGRDVFEHAAPEYVERAVKEPRTVYDDIVDRYG